MLVWWSTEDAQLVFRWVKLCVKLSFVDSGCVWWRAGMAYCKILRASPAAVLDSRFAFDSIQILSQIAFWFALYPLASLWRLQNCVPIKIIDNHHQQGKSNQISQPQSLKESDQSDTPQSRKESDQSDTPQITQGIRLVSKEKVIRLVSPNRSRNQISQTRLNRSRSLIPQRPWVLHYK